MAKPEETPDLAWQLRVAESTIEFYREREEHFGSVLKVADGGQYRNDWDAKIRELLRRLELAEGRSVEGHGKEPTWSYLSRIPELLPPERTPGEWGNLACSLPGFRWLAGMYQLRPRIGTSYIVPRDDWKPWDDETPAVDHPGTTGWLLALLGEVFTVDQHCGGDVSWWTVSCRGDKGFLIAGGRTLGQACVELAIKNGRWPGVKPPKEA